jgi:hypothetical protein
MKRSIKLSAFLILFFAAGLAGAGEGYVLNMYHFNLQYVAGSEKAMREGVVKGFEPLLDVYLAHPGWRADFELQGEFITYMAKNYPAVLEKFHKLAKNGQAEVVSFHYSDQLILGFPALDQERSIKLTKEIFEKYDIPLSGVIFTQEAQFGEGVCVLGGRHGYKVAVMTAGGYNAFQDDPGLPYFSCHGIEVLKAENPDQKPEIEKAEDYQDAKSGVRVKWHFLGDGELVVTGGASPYSPLFRPNQTVIKKLESDFARYEKDGYRIATVSEYVDALHRNNIRPRPLKPMLDTPWRPEDDQGVFTWMGKYVLPRENDYGIRTENWTTRSWLLAAEKSGLKWDQLREAWMDQLDAEVTDSTGWFPFPVELKYSPEKSALVIEQVKKLCPSCKPDESRPAMDAVTEKEFPVKPSVVGGSAVELKYFKVKGREGLYAVEAKFRAGSDARLAFPFTGPEIIYSPAMMEDQVVHIPLDRIKHRLHYVGLPNGLIALDQGVWLIRDNRAGMVGCGIDPDKKEIHFRTKGAAGKEFFYRVYIFKGAEKDALDFANQLNQVLGS